MRFHIPYLSVFRDVMEYLREKFTRSPRKQKFQSNTSDMPRNVEIKARVRNLDKLLARAQHLSGGPPMELRQEDTFFNVTNGRLKLRKESSARHNEAWLIHYNRPDGEGPRLCEYRKYPASDCETLQAVLRDALGEKGKVLKIRRLFLVGQTRVHIDSVTDLGNFMELEVVLQENQSEEVGHCIARSLMQKLCISEQDLITVAYMDLLLTAPCE